MSRTIETGHHVIEIFADRGTLSQAAAELFLASGARCVQERAAFNVALAGGSTPRDMYRELARGGGSPPLDWSKVEFYFGDERAVAHTDAHSNYRMVDECLFTPLAIDAARQHPMPTACTALQVCAERYARQLQALPMHQGRPVFDLCLLGMGEDGHTASLFPATPAVEEQDEWVKAVYVHKLQSWRLTLTLPVINNARQVVVLVSGESKADTLRQAIYEPHLHLPIQAVSPASPLRWYVDEAAAGSL